MEKKEQKIYDFFQELKIPYTVYEHEALFTIEAAEELDKKLGLEICKNLFLSSRHGTEFFLLLMPGHKKFRTGEVSKQLHVPRMTFASAQEMELFLGVTPGSVTPLGLINDKENKVKLLIDRDVLKEEKIAVHPLVNTATVVINTKDLIEKLLPAFGHDYIAVEMG